MCKSCKEGGPHEENKVAEQVGEAVVEGAALLGKGTIWLGRMLANGAVGASNGISKEWKRQQEEKKSE